MAVNGSVSKGSVNGAEDLPEDDVDDVDDVEVHPKSRVVSPPKKRSRRLPIVALGVVVLAAVAVAAVLLSSSPSKPKASPPKNPNPSPGFLPFVDQKANLRLSYPPSWTVVKSADADVPLQLNFGAAGLDTLLVRVVPLTTSVDTSNEANIKAFTDAVLSGTNITVLKQEAIKVNQVPGYYYLYTLPKDPATGITLVHSHFFVFPPHEMVSLTFQTVNADFAGLAPTFDKVVSSLQPGT